jgi:hypothetical protein
MVVSGRLERSMYGQTKHGKHLDDGQAFFLRGAHRSSDHLAGVWQSHGAGRDVAATRRTLDDPTAFGGGYRELSYV